MKKLLYTIIALLVLTDAFAQEDVRATCKSAGTKIQAWFKPTMAQVTFPNSGTNNVIAIIVVFSLPASGASNTSTAPVPLSVACPAFPGISFQSYPTALINDRFIYTYYNNPVGVATQTAWAVNVEKHVLELTFGPDVADDFPRLDNYWNSGGGPNFFDYFYFEVNGNQRSDTYGVPFYDGVMGTYGGGFGDQYVQATSPLPITLVSFVGQKLGDRSSLLQWSTASETNSSHFVVQRSTNRIDWTSIGSVDAAGNSQIIKNYEFIDLNVYNGIDNKLSVYYRLQMIDRDGQKKNSSIENVVFGKQGLAALREFLVYPNPASDGVQVEWQTEPGDQPTALELYDVTGKLVFTQDVADNSDQEYIDFGLANIKSGMYLLRILNGDRAIEHKQIVVGHNR